jgi:hypothetical protein
VRFDAENSVGVERPDASLVIVEERHTVVATGENADSAENLSEIASPQLHSLRWLARLYARLHMLGRWGQCPMGEGCRRSRWQWRRQGTD